MIGLGTWIPIYFTDYKWVVESFGKILKKHHKMD